jgi:putative MATE family efflux protein
MFAIPLLLGNLLQQFYNAVDSAVVGNFVSYEALAAVGSTGPLINMIISLAQGLSQGASVMVARHYGAGDKQKLHDTVHTAVLLSAIIGVVLSVVGVIFCPALLRFMGTPEDIMDGAVLYLRIFFSGFVFTSLYNTGTAILTAVGDSRRPLYFLAVSALLNVVGDLLFVLVFDMGIAGVAISTVLAQIVSVVLVGLVLVRTEEDYRLSIRQLSIKVEHVKFIANIGLPTAVQSTIVSFSNVIVQSYFNGLGAVAVAGYAASNKIDGFAQLPIVTMSMAVSTFVAQNLGAGQVKRARQGVKYSMALAIGITAILTVLAYGFTDPLLRVFTKDTIVLADAIQFFHTIAPFYVVLAFTQVIPGALRGAGSVKFTSVASVVCFVFLRQIYLGIFTRIDSGSFYTIVTVTLGYPLTWSLCAIANVIYYLKSDWSGFEKAPASSEANAV